MGIFSGKNSKNSNGSSALPKGFGKSKNGNYVKNMLRSVKMSSTEALKELTPTISQTLSDNTSYVKQTYSDFKTKLNNKNPSNYIKDNGMKLVKNLTNSLKTGKFYNESGETEEIMKSMGIDFDMSDFDLDSNELQSSSSSEEIFNEDTGKNVHNTKNIFLNMNDNGATNAVVEGSSAVIKNASAGFSQVSDLLSNILEFHTSKTSSFYNEMSEKISQMGNSMSRLEKLMAGSSQASLLSLKANEKALEDLLNQNSLSLEWMVKNLKKNNPMGGMGDFMGSMLKGGIGKFVGNPLGTLMTLGIKALIPSKTKSKLKGLDGLFGNLPILLNTLGMNMSKAGGTKGTIGDLLAAMTGGKTKYNGKTNYSVADKKGVATFDNETKTTINRVIPGLLSKILASVSNDKFYQGELVYDMNSGSFLTSADYSGNMNKKAKKAKYDTYAGNELMSALKGKTGNKVSDKDLTSLVASLVDSNVANKSDLNKATSGMNSAIQSAISDLFASNPEMIRKAVLEGINNSNKVRSEINLDNAAALADSKHSNDRRNISGNKYRSGGIRSYTADELNELKLDGRLGKLIDNLNGLVFGDYSGSSSSGSSNPLKDAANKMNNFGKTAGEKSRAASERAFREQQRKRNSGYEGPSLGNMGADSNIGGTVVRVNGQNVVNVNNSGIESRLDTIINLMSNSSTAESSTGMIALTDSGYTSKFEQDNMEYMVEISGKLTEVISTVAEVGNSMVSASVGLDPSSNTTGKYGFLDKMSTKIKGVKSKFASIGSSFGKHWKSFTGKISNQYKKMKDKYASDKADRDANSMFGSKSRADQKSRTNAFTERMKEMWESIKSGDFLTKIPIIGPLFAGEGGLGSKIGGALGKAGSWAWGKTKAIGSKAFDLGKKGISAAGNFLSSTGTKLGGKVGGFLSNLGADGGGLDTAKAKVKGLFGGKSGKVDLSFIPKGVTPVWIVGRGKKSYVGGGSSKDNSPDSDSGSSFGDRARGLFNQTKNYFSRDGGLVGKFKDFNSNRKQYGLGNAFKLEKSKFEGKTNRQIGGQKSQMTIKNREKMEAKAAKREEMREALKDKSLQARLKAQEIWEASKRKATEVKDFAFQKAEQAKQAAFNLGERAKDAASNLKVRVTNATQDIKEKLKETVSRTNTGKLTAKANAIFESVVSKIKGGMDVLSGGIKAAANAASAIPLGGKLAALGIAAAGLIGIIALAKKGLGSVNAATTNSDGTISRPKEVSGSMPKAASKTSKDQKKKAKKMKNEEGSSAEEGSQSGESSGMISRVFLISKKGLVNTTQGFIISKALKSGDNSLNKNSSSLGTTTNSTDKKGSIKKVLMVGPKSGLMAGLIIEGSGNSSSSANKTALNSMGKDYLGMTSKNTDDEKYGGIKTKNQNLGSMTADDFFKKLFCVIYHQGSHLGYSSGGSSGLSMLGSSGSGSTGSLNNSNITASGSNNEEIAYNFFRQKGLTHNQAVGIMGNIYQESGFNTNNLSTDTDGLPSYGLIQWHDTRYKSLQEAAQKQGVNTDDINFQLNYLYNEVLDPNTYYGKKLSSAGFYNSDTSIADATYLFNKYVEVSAGSSNIDSSNNQKRIGYANNYSSKYNGSSYSTNSSTDNLSSSNNSSSGVNFGGGWQRLCGNLNGLYISSKFNSREAGIHDNGHSGIDITGAGINGKPFYAAESGTVIESGYNGDWGNTVLIEHADGTKTRYAHASSLCVNKGDYVQRGQQLGCVGSTGYSTGPHLHFGIMDKNGKYIDPAPLLSGEGSSAVFNNGSFNATQSNGYSSDGSNSICSAGYDPFSASKITLTNEEKQQMIKDAYDKSKKSVEKLIGKVENEALDNENNSSSLSSAATAGNPLLSNNGNNSTITSSGNGGSTNYVVSGNGANVTKNINGNNGTIKIEVSCADAKQNHYDFEKYSTLKDILDTCRKIGSNSDSMVSYLKKILDQLKNKPDNTSTTKNEEEEKFNLDTTGLDLIFKGY